MNKQKLLLFVIALAMIGGSAALLNRLHTHQKLGRPGVKTQPLPDSPNLLVVLPKTVLNYDSEPLEVAEIVTNTLPKDTSYGQRLYHAPDGFSMVFYAVLMGTDRTSLHKPQYCLEGSGWRVDQSATRATTIPVQRPFAYDLPVVRLSADRPAEIKGEQKTVKAVYVYWYVADGSLSASVSGFQRMWWMARNLIRTGELQRWAYISCLAHCYPGQEDATFERVKEFITAAVPEFQLTPSAPQTTASARP